MQKLCFVLMTTIALSCVAMFGFGQTKSADYKAPVPDKVDVKAADEPSQPGGSRIGFMKRRKLGLTVRDIRGYLKELKEAEAIEIVTGPDGKDQLVHPEAVAVDVIAMAQAANPEAWAAVLNDDRDWEAFFEALFAFLEKLLPLLISLFGGL